MSENLPSSARQVNVCTSFVLHAAELQPVSISNVGVPVTSTGDVKVTSMKSSSPTPYCRSGSVESIVVILGDPSDWTLIGFGDTVIGKVKVP